MFTFSRSGAGSDWIIGGTQVPTKWWYPCRTAAHLEMTKTWMIPRVCGLHQVETPTREQVPILYLSSAIFGFQPQSNSLSFSNFWTCWCPIEFLLTFPSPTHQPTGRTLRESPHPGRNQSQSRRPAIKGRSPQITRRISYAEATWNKMKLWCYAKIGEGYAFNFYPGKFGRRSIRIYEKRLESLIVKRSCLYTSYLHPSQNGWNCPIVSFTTCRIQLMDKIPHKLM